MGLGIKKGDKVTGDCSRFCGECANCRIDKNLCTTIEKFCITTDGASAEYIIRDAAYLYKAPENISLEFLSLAEPLAVAFHLLNKIKEALPDLGQKNILIFGAGPIGISALILLRNYFACEKISVFDIARNRIRLAETLGATIPKKRELAIDGEHSNYGSLYSGLKYDVVIETTGVADVIAATISLARPLGVIGLLGMVPKVTANFKNIVVKALKIVGSIGGTGEFLDIIDFIHKHPDLVKPMISHRYHIMDTRQAFEVASDVEQAHKILLYL